MPPGAAAEWTTSNLDIKADAELTGSGFLCYLCSLDYGTLCFLPSDRDTLIPHGRPLSTAWSSAECHWHRSLSNRSKSSTPATGRPLRCQPQPQQAKGGDGRQKWEEIFRSLASRRVKKNKKKQKEKQNIQQPKKQTAGNTVTRLWRAALIALPILHWVRAPPEAE